MNVNRVLDAFQDTMLEVLENKEQFVLSGYFRLVPKEVGERVRRNPKTGENVTVPAGWKVTAKPGSKVRRAV